MERAQGSPQITFVPDGCSRREFIRGSAAIAAAFGVTLTSMAEAEEKRQADAKNARPVNCAFIGVGDQGYNVDFKAALTVPGVKMVAVADRYQPYLDRALKDVPGATGYNGDDGFKRIMDRKDIEAVLIATPLYLHAPIAIAALQSGKHVFTEKMMAWSIEDAKAMAHAALASKKVLQIGHQRRANPMYNHAWELINSKKICGQITHVRAQWNRNGSWRKPPLPGMDDRHRNWRMYREYSHGLMSELGTHQIHAVNWFLGGAPKSVVAMGGCDYWKDGRTISDNVEVIYEYPNGVKLNYTSLTTNQYDGYYEQFMGKDGTLVISEERETPAAFYREPTAQAEDWMKNSVGGAQTGKHKEIGLKLDPQATKKVVGPGVKIGEKSFAEGAMNKSAYVLEMEDFFNAIRTGAPVTCDWREALGCCVAAVKANEAIDKKARLEIPASCYTL